MKNEMTLLLFTIMGIDFAMDVEHITAMVPVESLTNKKSGIVWFHEKVNFPQTPVVYDSPKALHIVSGTGPFHLIIDAPRDMPVEVPAEQINPFPVLVNQFTKDSPFRAVYLMEKRMMLVVEPLAMFP
ncbi:hypothetical protein SAMN02746065_105171 [Desulfocicer vacuolatum DSM 3385]|uniref:Uncharacterized protein n=1 Tax=Desulfocicer vacuolatum DSM 3385 TaxID=1121400 RepID=A0A1W2AKZ6_9BACT|nr:hypothetical protein [Desulfocicer vacuolatum]SMC61121.1 hypothetical protein SAMN02746065_105171 [Desulfocicer vacuolatum DSM 3385]